jgi:hypothetical protein
MRNSLPQLAKLKVHRSSIRNINYYVLQVLCKRRGMCEKRLGIEEKGKERRKPTFAFTAVTFVCGVFSSSMQSILPSRYTTGDSGKKDRIL